MICTKCGETIFVNIEHICDDESRQVETTVRPLIDGRYNFTTEYCEYEKQSWCELPKYKRCKYCIRCIDGSKACEVKM